MRPLPERRAAAEAAFRKRLSDAGATLLEQWTGVERRYRILCARGHEGSPFARNVIRRTGEICSTCAHRNPAATEAAFLQIVSGLGATALYETWRGSQKAHHLRCPTGHDCYPQPTNVLRGTGICKICAGQDVAAAEVRFLEHLSAYGAVMIGRYTTSREPVHVRCAAGHDCWPMPTNIRKGQGVCNACKGRAWNAFYVLEHSARPVVKFGITSRQGKQRLYDHKRTGFTAVRLLVLDLPDLAARRTENAVKAALRDAGEKPVRGVEYFDISCLGLILDVATSWLGETDERLVS